MSEVVKKEVCKCENCGNEAEMVVTCTLADVDVDPKPVDESDTVIKPEAEKRVKGTATCTHCGNESDMWIDL